MEFPINTSGYWLNKLPRGYRERAFRQVPKKSLLTIRPDIAEVILYDLPWSNPEEPDGFWNMVYNYYRLTSLKNDLPPLPSNDYNRYKT